MEKKSDIDGFFSLMWHVLSRDVLHTCDVQSLRQHFEKVELEPFDYACGALCVVQPPRATARPLLCRCESSEGVKRKRLKPRQLCGSESSAMSRLNWGLFRTRAPILYYLSLIHI